jgi:hypothetical protein
MAQEIARAEAAMAVLGKGRMIGHRARQAEPAELRVGEVQMDLLASRRPYLPIGSIQGSSWLVPGFRAGLTLDRTQGGHDPANGFTSQEFSAILPPESQG